MKQRLHYGWVMLAATLVVLVTTAGFRSTVGILVDLLRDEFGWTTASISLAAGLNVMLYGSGGPFARGPAFARRRVSLDPDRAARDAGARGRCVIGRVCG